MPSLNDLRRFAVNRQFGAHDLASAIERLGFVQADPIRAPARAQDLTLRHRVRGYRAGDLERQYAKLPIEEDFFINYGFVSRRVSALMHPRDGAGLLPSASNQRAKAVWQFVREGGEVHPRAVDARFAHGNTVNYWGGQSSVTTRLLELMHYKGLLRVARREAGIRIYAVHEHQRGKLTAAERRERIDALADVVIRKYAPLPSTGLSLVVRRLRYAVPQWTDEMTRAQARAKQRMASVTIGGETWYWPADEPINPAEAPDEVRFLAPFDPLVWDRGKFEQLWGWPYRFEAYTPAPKRKHGYYALPLLWREQVIGWVNVSGGAGSMRVEAGYVRGRAPRDRGFKGAFEAEVERLRTFLTPSRR